MNFIRSLVHVLWMAITVIPWALFVVLISYFVSSTRLYWICAGWLRLAVNSGTWILGIENRIQGMENLPIGTKDPAVLLVKHQSTWETFVMPAIMPHPLAYVFKKELLHVPFFGWAMARMDMIHIDRKQRSRAFAKVVQQGRRLMAEGVWVIMFPEGTRIPRGQKGEYKSGRCAGDPDCRDLGALLAHTGVRQKARRGGHLHRPRHCERRPQRRRAHAGSRDLDRVRDAPP